MAINIGNKKYIPGMYPKKIVLAPEMAEKFIVDWERKRTRSIKEEKAKPKLLPTICFSRKIGVGALEIADILAEKIGYRVVDREILEHIAGKANLSEKTVSFFDERYPGLMDEFLSLLFGEKSFIKSDYTKILFRTVISVAHMEPTIFVGRGTHLILPRSRVLAVRFICDRSYRVRRLAQMLDAKEEETQNRLDQIDKEQSEFFKKVFGKKNASPYEFDMVINCDYISKPESAAQIVAQAFKEKFGNEAM